MLRAVKWMLTRPFGPIVSKGANGKIVEGDAFEKARRDDAIGVDVSPDNGDAAAAVIANRALRKSLSGHGRSVRTSVTWPVTAAAATIAGLISKVRPLAEP